MILMLLASTISFADVNYYQAKTVERNIETIKADREARLARAKTLSEMSQKSNARKPSAESSIRNSLRAENHKRHGRNLKHKVHLSVLEKIKSRRGKR